MIIARDEMVRPTLRWRSLGHLLESAAVEHTEKPLFIFKGATISYGAINRRVNRIANGLRTKGVAHGDRVGVMLPNGVEFPVTWLAIAKLGAVMVPINTGYKEHDLAYILSDSEAETLVIHEDFLAVFENIRRRVGSLKRVVVLGHAPDGTESFREMEEEASPDFAIMGVGEDDLMNIQYTSGTTGFPKGCMLTHRYWMLLGSQLSEISGMRPDDVDLTVQPFYYMDPQWNTVLCLVNGIPLVIVPRFSPSAFWQIVKEHGVTFVYVIGTMPYYLLNQDEDPELEQNHALRVVYCSGINPQHHELFERRWNVPWREAFGMTETGCDLIVRVDDDERTGSGALGDPFPGKEVKVIDGEGKELAAGGAGELVIKGEPMMLGYWNKPDATARTIRDGWLHTGDLAVRDERGDIRLVGRIKDMVRRTGENISCTEVESVLVDHGSVAVAAVVPVPDQLRGEEVKAYLLLREGIAAADVDPEEIIAFCKQRLAQFKIPRYIEFVDELPRTPSERVEKHKLIEGKADLRIGSYDAVQGGWITESEMPHNDGESQPSES
jgi:crotonobetaine/carnitine-CoA ligase